MSGFDSGAYRDATVTIDGVQLPPHRGVWIGLDDHQLPQVPSSWEREFLEPDRYVAWETRLKSDGTYEKHRQLDPTAEVIAEGEGFRIEFCNGEGVYRMAKEFGRSSPASSGTASW